MIPGEPMYNSDIFEQFKAKNKKIFDEMGLNIDSYEFTVRGGNSPTGMEPAKFLKDMPIKGHVDTSLKGMTADRRLQMLGKSRVSQNVENAVITRSRNYFMVAGIITLSIYSFFMLFL
jgi:hypothetical protein